MISSYILWCCGTDVFKVRVYRACRVFIFYHQAIWNPFQMYNEQKLEIWGAKSLQRSALNNLNFTLLRIKKKILWLLFNLNPGPLKTEMGKKYPLPEVEFKSFVPWDVGWSVSRVNTSPFLTQDLDFGGVCQGVRQRASSCYPDSHNVDVINSERYKNDTAQPPCAAKPSWDSIILTECCLGSMSSRKGVELNGFSGQSHRAILVKCAHLHYGDRPAL